MRLAFSGVEEIAASRDHVWAQLLDHRVVGSCAPGVESVEATGADRFNVIAAFGVGSVRLRFAIGVKLSDLDPPRSANMSVRGQAPGSALNAESSISLEAVGPNSTRLAWSISSDVHGTVANVGARLLGGTAKRLTARFWKAFAKRVARPVEKKKPAAKGKKARS